MSRAAASPKKRVSPKRSRDFNASANDQFAENDTEPT